MLYSLKWQGQPEKKFQLNLAIPSIPDIKVKEKENDHSMFSWLNYKNRPVFSCQFCDVAKVVIIHNKDLAKFGYTPDSESQFSKKWIHNCIFLANETD